MIHYAREIHTDGRVLIIDRVVNKEAMEQLFSLETRGGTEINALDTHMLTRDLETLIRISGFIIPQETLFLFPGNGGKEIRHCAMLHQEYWWTGVFAKRMWNVGDDPFTIVGEALPKQTLALDIEVVFVLDDVMSSGETISKLFARNSWKFPRATWVAGSWISRGKRVSNYQKIFSAVIVRHRHTPAKKVPINSLSTLQEDHEIATSYAERHFRKPEAFLEILDAITSLR